MPALCPKSGPQRPGSRVPWLLSQVWYKWQFNKYFSVWRLSLAKIEIGEGGGVVVWKTAELPSRSFFPFILQDDEKRGQFRFRPHFTIWGFLPYLMGHLPVSPLQLHFCQRQRGRPAHPLLGPVNTIFFFFFFGDKMKGKRLLPSLRSSYQQVSGSITSKIILVGTILLEDIKLVLIYHERHRRHPALTLASQNLKANDQAHL